MCSGAARPACVTRSACSPLRSSLFRLHSLSSWPSKPVSILSFSSCSSNGAPENASVLYGITEPAATLASAYEVKVVATDSHRPPQIYLALTVVWLAGSLAILLLWGIRRRRFARSLRLGQTIQHGREWEALMRARRSLRLKRNVGLVISPLKIEPAVWRVWRPTVVLPDSIASHLDDDELEAIMLHELVHIQRRDNLIGNLQLALCALLWFHPLVWFISRKLFDEREQACDERVMEVCRAPEAYASSILKVVRFCFGWRVAGVIGAASGSNLRRRIENIMSIGNAKRVSRMERLACWLACWWPWHFSFIVAAGFYSRPYAVNAVGKDSLAAQSVSNSVSEASTTSITQPDGTQSPGKARTAPPPPPPPPAEPVIAAPPAPPSASTPPRQSTPGPAPSTPPAPPSQPSAAIATSNATNAGNRTGEAGQE